MRHQSVRLGLCLVIGICLAPGLRAQDPQVKVLDPRLKIELFAEHPQIVTPTGIDVDHQGRVWAIESNTHFPPEGYQGHKADRILVFRDANGDGKAEEPTVFVEGLVHSMSIAVRPEWFPLTTKPTNVPPAKLSVYVATRSEIILFHDDDGDLKADRREQLVHLDTKGDYPHNGLAGISFDALGNMFFGFGENLGADYKIIGSDGKTLSGGNEGGNIYRCNLDGSQLTHWATGFWNPHATCVDAFGRLFAVDNDPDSRPPCRLLHIIPGGDYGYRFRNGRKGLHPFTAWNGEIPGTLPMVAGTGEAPSGIVSYESDGLPGEYYGNLLVGSWGDHRIDRFQLKAKGTSFTSLAEPIVTGNENFRPVGLSVAPDGSLFFTDWVLREYKLHGKGRIWRVSAVKPRIAPVVMLATLPSATTVELYGHLKSSVGPVRRMAAYLLGHSNDGLDLLVSQVADNNEPTRSRLEAFWAAANVSLQPQPPVKLLLSLRAMSAARSDSSNRFSGDSRLLGQTALAALWVESDATIPHNPVLDNLLDLTHSDRSSVERGGSLSQLAVELTKTLKPDEILPRRPDTNRGRGGFGMSQPSLSDPFILSLTVDRLAQVPDVAQFRKWWEAWQTPPAAPEFPQQFSDQRGNPLAQQLQTLRAEQMRHARTALVLGARRKFPQDHELLATFLRDSEPLVRRLAVQWIAELKLKDLRPAVEGLLKQETLDSDLFLTTLAALEMLDGVSPENFDKTPASKYVLPLVTKEGPATVRKLALRLVSPADPALTAELYNQLLASQDNDLRLEAIRTLQLSPLPAASELLQKVATGTQQPLIDQAEAVAGLAPAAKTAAADSPLRKLLDSMVLGDNATLRIEALRAFRGTTTGRPSPAIAQLQDSLKLKPAANSYELMEQIRLATADQQPAQVPKVPSNNRPANIEGWYDAAGVASFRDGINRPVNSFPRSRPGEASTGPTADSAAGRRTFFHVNSAGCFKCHTIDGRGGKIGPDLTLIARTMDRTKLAQSILEPTREMAPQFVPWTFELKSGKVLTGLILSEESEKLKIGTAEGQTVDLTLNEIETRTPQKISLMPEKLIDQLTVQEFLDVLAYLETLK